MLLWTQCLGVNDDIRRSGSLLTFNIERALLDLKKEGGTSHFHVQQRQTSPSELSFWQPAPNGNFLPKEEAFSDCNLVFVSSERPPSDVFIEGLKARNQSCEVTRDTTLFCDKSTLTVDIESGIACSRSFYLATVQSYLTQRQRDVYIYQCRVSRGIQLEFKINELEQFGLGTNFYQSAQTVITASIEPENIIAAWHAKLSEQKETKGGHQFVCEVVDEKESNSLAEQVVLRSLMSGRSKIRIHKPQQIIVTPDSITVTDLETASGVSTVSSRTVFDEEKKAQEERQKYTLLLKVPEELSSPSESKFRYWEPSPSKLLYFRAKDSAFSKPKFVFRGDSRAPDDIFKIGFFPKIPPEYSDTVLTESCCVMGRRKGFSLSRYELISDQNTCVCFSKRFDVAAQYPKVKADSSHDGGVTLTYVYLCFAHKGIKLYKKAEELTSQNLDTSVAVKTKEIVSPSVAVNDILCAWKVQRTKRTVWYGTENYYEVVSDELPNPSAHQEFKYVMGRRGEFFQPSTGRVDVDFNGIRDPD
ncbi:hypothetical protein [Parashewanella tropica]|uniref:hypothetical protein n=1 Tax=Parashewanella tropica TaxID=2547970 RepID=UPI00105A39DA|nr:hypothetical protein [Parashewanella tropica]